MHLQGYSESDGPLQILDFSNTATVEFIGVYDAAGNLVPNAVIQTASGVIYANGSAVPEPATMATFGFGVVLGGVIRIVGRKLLS